MPSNFLSWKFATETRKIIDYENSVPHDFISDARQLPLNHARHFDFYDSFDLYDNFFDLLNRISRCIPQMREDAREDDWIYRGWQKTRWVDFKNGLKLKKKKKRESWSWVCRWSFKGLVLRLFLDGIQDIGFGIGIASSPVNQLSTTKLYGRGNQNKSTIDRF